GQADDPLDRRLRARRSRRGDRGGADRRLPRPDPAPMHQRLPDAARRQQPPHHPASRRDVRLHGRTLGPYPRHRGARPGGGPAAPAERKSSPPRGPRGGARPPPPRGAPGAPPRWGPPAPPRGGAGGPGP